MWAGLLGAALAGVEPELTGWPDDVRPPAVHDCPDVRWPPGTEGPRATLRVLGTLGEDGELREAAVVDGPELLHGPTLEAVSACLISPAVFAGAPAEVPLELVVTVEPPPVALTARVRLRGDGGPVPDVPLLVGEAQARVGPDGIAVFRNLPPGQHPVRSGDPRYRVAGDSTVGTGPGATAEIWLAAEAGWELVARYSPETDRPNTHVITREEIRLTPGSLGDPVRAVAARPGLVRTPFDSGWLIVRGGDPGDTGMYLDGVRIPLLYHLGGFVSVVHPNLVEEVRFWPGSTPARTGRQISGAVDVIPRRLGDERRIQAGANLAFAQAYVEVPTHRGGGFAAAFRRSYLDGLLAAVYGREGARIAPRFWDVQARLTGRRYGLTFLGLSDGIDAPTGEADETVEIRQSAVQLQGRIDVPVRELELRITPWVASWARSVQGRRDPQRTDELLPGMRIELRPKQRQGLGWVAGVEGEARTYAIRQGTVQRRKPAQLVDPYLDLRIGRGLQVDVGMRGESLFVAGQLPRFELSPRGSVRWRATDWLTLTTEASRSHRPPDAALLIGLPDGAYLQLERADAVGAGFTVGREALSFTATGWARRMSRLAGFEADGSVDGMFGRAEGLETQLVWEGQDLTVRAIYELTRSTRWEDPGGELDLRVTPWDQPHRLQVVGLLRLPADWSLSGRLRYSSGFPAPRRETNTFDILTGATAVLHPELGRLTPFASADLKLTRRFLLKTWQIEAFVDLQNMGPRVFEPIITGFDDTEPAYSKGLPFLPLFGVDAVFWPGRAPKPVP